MTEAQAPARLVDAVLQTGKELGQEATTTYTLSGMPTVWQAQLLTVYASGDQPLHSHVDLSRLGDALLAKGYKVVRFVEDKGWPHAMLQKLEVSRDTAAQCMAAGDVREDATAVYWLLQRHVPVEPQAPITFVCQVFSKGNTSFAGNGMRVTLDEAWLQSHTTPVDEAYASLASSAAEHAIPAPNDAGRLLTLIRSGLAMRAQVEEQQEWRSTDLHPTLVHRMLYTLDDGSTYLITVEACDAATR